MSRQTKKIVKLPSQIIAGLVVVYQRTLSPDHSWLAGRFPYGFCRHYPSCSEYSRQSFLKFGVVRGLLLSIRRLATCHPWAKPSVDTVPQVTL